MGTGLSANFELSSTAPVAFVLDEGPSSGADSAPACGAVSETTFSSILEILSVTSSWVPNSATSLSGLLCRIDFSASLSAKIWGPGIAEMVLPHLHYSPA